MPRVSENSNTDSVRYTLNKAKNRMEDLQMKGSTLRNVNKPSDNPLSNIQSLRMSSATSNNNQYIKNANYAKLHLNATENALEQLTDIIGKAKQIAIAQASDFYGDDVRSNVANEVIQLRNQAIAIANKRVGQKYIFGGYKTTTPPFDVLGKYSGDKGHITLEVSKDFFVPINLSGHEVFYTEEKYPYYKDHPLNNFPEFENAPKQPIKEGEGHKLPTVGRELASYSDNAQGFERRENILSQLDMLTTALENNDPEMVQGLLESFDRSATRLITLRTRVGSISNSIDTSIMSNEDENISNATRNSELVDADIAELFSDITRQKDVLTTSYKASQAALSRSLIDFIKN